MFKHLNTIPFDCKYLGISNSIDHFVELLQKDFSADRVSINKPYDTQ